MNEFPRKRTRARREYEVGYEAYVNGLSFDAGAPAHWKMGFFNARNSGAITGRIRVRVGDGDHEPRRTDSSGR